MVSRPALRVAPALLTLLLALNASLLQAAPAAAPGLPATSASAPRPIGHDAYAGWRSIQGTQLSRDGRFAAYALVGQESDGELVVRRLSDGHEWRVPRGSAPQFSADSRYLAFAVQPTRAELDKARKDKKKGEDAPKPGAGLMSLSSGAYEILPRIRRFAFGEDGGTALALLLEPAARKESARKDEGKSDTESDQEAPADGGPPLSKKKEAGTELRLIDLDRQLRLSFKDVASFAWSRKGAALAFAVSVKEAAKDAPKDAGKDSPQESAATAAVAASGPGTRPTPDSAREGVYLLRAGQVEAQPLLTGAGHYKQLQLDDAGQQVAFVSNRDALAAQAARTSPDKSPPSFTLYHWRQGQAAPEAQVLVSSETPGLPAGYGPSEHGALQFSKDGQRLFLGTAELPKPEPKDAPEPLKVDLWHYKDPELQSMQKVKAEREKQRSYRAVVHLADRRLVQLATVERPDLIVNDNAVVALGLNERPYRALQSWDALYRDAYAVDLNTGRARLLALKLRETPRLSPTGRYVIGFVPESRQWMAWQTADARPLPLTAGIKAHFEDVERDVVEASGPYGLAGWSADDRSVVLYDQFDLWSVSLDSLKAHNLSQGWGRKQQVQLRLQVLEPEIAEGRKPLSEGDWLLQGTHVRKRNSGFYRLEAKGGEPRPLLLADKMLGGLLKARDADVLLHTEQRFDEFPNLWLSDAWLAHPGRISDANPQQTDYRWGSQELIEYTSADGRKLQALLAKPADFVPGKKYPLMVYIYEKMTDNLHRYVPPAPAQNINVTRYVSQGYLVLRPDIVYTIGHPGKSAMNTVLPAVQQLIRQGLVDEKRIGIQGHSWGAYETNYLITHSTMFRAAEAGASMANMISGYGGIRWGTGASRAFQYEQQQSRIGATPWDRPELYVENSPIFHVHKVQTPYLTVHNDEDDAVPYYQAIEFFTALRRLGKEAYWFNYNGEKHGLRDREAIKHFTVHMGEFFDHYLLGAPRPDWMDKPVPYLERGKRDVNPLFKPPAAAPTTP